MAKKLNKKQLFSIWVDEIYPNKENNVSRETKIRFAFNRYKKEINLDYYKTKCKSSILWEYFIKILNEKKLDLSHLKKNNNCAEISFEKVRKKIIKKAKGNLDVNSFYLSNDWLFLKRKVHKLYKCGCMKCFKDNVETHIDHILPRSKYPQLSLDIHNLQILCKSCNMEKSNKDYTDYRTDEQRRLCSLKYP